MTLESLQSELNELKKRIDEAPQHFGQRFSNALASPNYVSGSSGWIIKENGDVEFNDAVLRGTLSSGDTSATHIIVDGDSGEIEFYGPDGVLQATMRGLSLAADGVDGVEIFPRDGAGYHYTFTSAGFTFPGGLFDGTVTHTSGAGINLGVDGVTPRITLNDVERITDEHELSLAMGATISSTDNVVTRKIPIKVNGTQYYLLATTSAS